MLVNNVYFCRKKRSSSSAQFCSLPLQSEHREVVALLCVAYKVGYSLRHPFDERAGLLGGGLDHLIEPFLTKHPAVGILSLVESVGITKGRFF